MLGSSFLVIIVGGRLLALIWLVVVGGSGCRFSLFCCIAWFSCATLCSGGFMGDSGTLSV